MRAIKRVNKKPVKINRRWKNVIKGVNASFDDKLGGGNIIMWGLKGRGRYRNLVATPGGGQIYDPYAGSGMPVYDDYFPEYAPVEDLSGGGNISYEPLPITTQLEQAAADFAIPVPAVTYQEPALHVETVPEYYQEQVAPVVDYIDPVIAAEPLHITWDPEPSPVTRVEDPVPFDNSQILGTSEPVITSPAPAQTTNALKEAFEDIKTQLGVGAGNINTVPKVPATEDNNGMYIAGGIAAIGILALLFKK